jgi:hypothetical protein
LEQALRRLRTVVEELSLPSLEARDEDAVSNSRTIGRITLTCS